MQRLGQHFLIDQRALKKISRAVAPSPGDTIIEIGAGNGELTNELFDLGFEVLGKNEKQIKIVAIEKDAALAEALKSGFADEERIEIITGDALKLLPKLPETYNLKSSNYKLVGNIPYYITGRLMRILSELEPKPSLSVFTVQKEVALRLAASVPHMNRLAAITQLWTTPKIIGSIKASGFSPPPKVESAIVSLKKRAMIPPRGELLRCFGAVRALFGQPRKTVLNNIAAMHGGRNKEKIVRVLRSLDVRPTARPHDLTLEKILEIASRLF